MPLLTVVPVINVLTNFIFCETIPLLNLAFELVSTTIHRVKVVVRELSHFSLTFPFISFQFPSAQFQSM